MLDRSELLPHLVAQLAGERGNSPAIVGVDGPTLTWSRLNDEKLRWAGAYRSAGASAGNTIATMVPNSFDAYLVWLGAAWLGAIEVPINNMYRGDMLRYIVDDSCAELLVISERFIDRLSAVVADLPNLKTVVVLGSEGNLPDLPCTVLSEREFLAGAEAVDDVAGPEPWDVAAMIYTSGTTGPSKGVLLPWAELHYFSSGSPDDLLEDGAPFYNIYPAFHISGKSSLYIATLHRAHVVFREALSVTEFWNDIRKYDIRAAALLGPIVTMLMSMPAQPDDADTPLRRVMMGPVVANVAEFKDRFGIEKVGTGYGSTEIGLAIVAGWGAPNPRTCGRRREGPPFYELRIVDEHDRPVAPGTVGELVVRTAEPWAMNIGYWNQPEKTAEAWRNGWFHTGDGFKEDDDGWLYFVDRMNDALRRRGENISSFEVEAGVNQHPAVAECAVVGVPSELGEDEVKVVVVRRSGESLSAQELLEFLEPRMPSFMVPRFVEFADALPKTDATLRVRKIELRMSGVTEGTWDRERDWVAQ